MFRTGKGPNRKRRCKVDLGAANDLGAPEGTLSSVGGKAESLASRSKQIKAKSPAVNSRTSSRFGSDQPDGPELSPSTPDPERTLLSFPLIFHPFLCPLICLSWADREAERWWRRFGIHPAGVAVPGPEKLLFSPLPNGGTDVAGSCVKKKVKWSENIWIGPPQTSRRLKQSTSACPDGGIWRVFVALGQCKHWNHCCVDPADVDFLEDKVSRVQLNSISCQRTIQTCRTLLSSRGAADRTATAKIKASATAKRWCPTVASVGHVIIFTF